MLTNVQIKDFIKSGLIKIDPFNPKLLGPNFYRLTIDSIDITRYSDKNGTLERDKCSLDEIRTYPLQGKQYVVCSIKERIILGKGMFGRFYPASYLIENGLMLSCGDLHSYYDDKIVFGLFNARDMEFLLDANMEIARISFDYVGIETPIEYDNPMEDTYNIYIELVRNKEKEVKEMENLLKGQKDKLDDLYKMLNKLKGSSNGNC